MEFDTEDQVLYHMQYQHLIYHISDTAPALHISCLIRSTNIYISHIFYIGTTSCISYNAPISYLFLISYASPTSHISYAETISLYLRAHMYQQEQYLNAAPMHHISYLICFTNILYLIKIILSYLILSYLIKIILSYLILWKR